MLTVEQRQERARAAIAHAKATLDDILAGIGGKPLAKRGSGDGELHDMRKASASGTEAAQEPSEELAKAVLSEVAAITGEYDPDKIVTIIEKAMTAKVNINDPIAAAAVARAVIAEQPTYTLALNGGGGAVAAADAARAVEQAEMLNLHKAAGAPWPVPPERLRELRSTAEALAYLRDNPIEPHQIGYAAKPWVDNRQELRDARDLARSRGNHGGAEMYQRELDLAEARAVVAAGPTSTDTWGGRIVHRPAA
jgi:hypothetical protein